MNTSRWYVVLLAGAVSACGASFSTADPLEQDPNSDAGVVDHQVGVVPTGDAGAPDGSPTPVTVGPTVVVVDPGVDAADPIDAGTPAEEAATPEASVVAEAAAAPPDAGAPVVVDSGSGTVPEASADAGTMNDANTADVVDALPPPPPPPPPVTCLVALAGVYLTPEENTKGIPSCTVVQELNGVYYITSSGVGNFSLMCQPSTTPCDLGNSCQSANGTDSSGNPLTGTCAQITPVTK